LKLSRGIEPIIATIIIVAVTLVIAIAVIGWIMGWWGTLTGGQEQLQLVREGSRIYNEGGQWKLTLHVVNRGGGTAVIYKIVVANCEAGKTEIGQATTPTGTSGITVDTNQGVIKVDPGADGYFTVPLGQGCTLTSGATYTVKVYTKANNEYPISITAE